MAVSLPSHRSVNFRWQRAPRTRRPNNRSHKAVYSPYAACLHLRQFIELNWRRSETESEQCENLIPLKLSSDGDGNNPGVTY